MPLVIPLKPTVDVDLFKPISSFLRNTFSELGKLHKDLINGVFLPKLTHFLESVLVEYTSIRLIFILESWARLLASFYVYMLH